LTSQDAATRSLGTVSLPFATARTAVAASGCFQMLTSVKATQCETHPEAVGAARTGVEGDVCLVPVIHQALTFFLLRYEARVRGCR
jgi:hypothetical protein